MKIRNGFVSNSSSSSFIIKWRFNNENNSLDWALIRLFDLFCGLCDEDINIKDWPDLLGEHEKHFEPVVKDILEKTKVVQEEPRIFETDFFTVMMNDINDYGDSAQKMLMALTLKSIDEEDNDFEIIEVKVDDLH